MGVMQMGALAAEQHGRLQRARPKPRKLDVNAVLHDYVQNRLQRRWSPEHISRRLRVAHGKDPDMTISQEAIYQALYVNSAGGLRRELKARLRTGQAATNPRRTTERRGQPIADMTSIVDRPLEALGRAVPGHWEGDLITGKDNKTVVGTLVDRCSRYLMLLHLPDRHGAEEVRDEMVNAIEGMPDRLRRTVTWEQGREMARHVEITATTGVQIYFCNPHSPWERPTNENTNGLLRQYLPKGTDLSTHSRTDLDAIQDQMNGRPRKALGWLTPTEYLTGVLEEDIAVALTE